MGGIYTENIIFKHFFFLQSEISRETRERVGVRRSWNCVRDTPRHEELKIIKNWEKEKKKKEREKRHLQAIIAHTVR